MKTGRKEKREKKEGLDQHVAMMLVNSRAASDGRDFTDTGASDKRRS